MVAINTFKNINKKSLGILSINGSVCKHIKGRLTKTISKYFTHGIVIEFESEDCLDAFLENDEIYSEKDAIAGITMNGYDGIIGFCLE